MAASRLLVLLLTLLIDTSSAFTSSTMASSSSSSASMQHQYPRPLHPGGFSLPPLVEDRLPIITSPSPPTTNSNNDNDGILQTNILLIKPPDMESLWEWYAYTKHQSDSDPSWGRVWPTALSLGRMVLRSLHDDKGGGELIIAHESAGCTKEQDLTKRAMHALRTSSHVVEVGCGLGVAGLVYASSMANIISSSESSSSSDECQKGGRTITFLDREPYALHCVMASASTNGMLTGPLVQPPTESTLEEDKEENDNTIPSVTARAAIDDWTLPTTDEKNNDTTNNNPIKNISYQDLHLNTLSNYSNENTILLASDILYEPSSMPSLAKKLQSLLHPVHGGYALLADPVKERTIGCRDSFVSSVHDLGGEVAILPLSDLESDDGADGLMMGSSGSRMMRNENMLLESDMDIDGSLAKTVLIVVHFEGTNAE